MKANGDREPRFEHMAKLLAIVEVDESDKVQCQEPGCGHGVYKRIHVVEVDGSIMVMGSTCYEKRFGSAPQLQNEFSGNGSGRRLTEAQRQLLLANTAALIEQFAAEANANRVIQQEALDRARKAIADRQALFDSRMAVLRLQRASEKPTPPPSMPWPWVKPMSSMAYFQLQEGQGWIRVMHTNGTHYVMPWPSFDGWDETLPPVVGAPDEGIGGYRVASVVDSVGYLRKHSRWEHIGIWRDIMAAISKAGQPANRGTDQ